MKFEIIFYQTLYGRIPVHDFLGSLDTKPRDKTVGLMELLQEHGTNLQEPYTKHLENGKFAKTPPSVINLAKKYRTDLITR